MLRQGLPLLRAAPRACTALRGFAAKTPLDQVSSKLTSMQQLTSMQISMGHSEGDKRPGRLLPILDTFAKHGLNLTHMESKLHQYSFGDSRFEFDFEGAPDDEATVQCVRELRELASVGRVVLKQPKTVPWFPTSLRELDDARTVLDGGTALISEDHPGFKDEEYKARRTQIVENAKLHRFGQPIPIVDYTEDENRTWTMVYDKLYDLQATYACGDFQRAMAKFNRSGVLTRERIPQLAEVSELLYAETGFQIRPVMGLLTARDFLNSLAFRVFWSTQYIRHHGNPFYTPEPDVCHELLGHVPLFAHPDFAEFSQTIGLQSLGATDEQIDQLATLYWFTVEFGVLQEPQGYRAYGAGVLSSFGELEWACAPQPSDSCRSAGGLQSYEKFKHLERPTMNPLNAEKASRTPFPITTYQPQYFVSPTLADAKKEVTRFCDSLSKPFFCRYDPFSQRIKVTRSINRDSQSTTADLQADKQREYFDNLYSSSEGAP